jgi:hypothetical protein
MSECTKKSLECQTETYVHIDGEHFISVRFPSVSIPIYFFMVHLSVPQMAQNLQNRAIAD